MKHRAVSEDIHPLDFEVFQDTELGYIKDLLVGRYLLFKGIYHTEAHRVIYCLIKT